MSEQQPKACLAPLAARAPRRFRLPAGSWDTHAHVIGAQHAYPMVASRHYTPPPQSPEDFLGMLDAVGQTYGLLVQVSVHGTDNRLLKEALRRHPQRLRGVAVFDARTSDAELTELRAAGVVGARVQTVAGGGLGPEHLDAVVARCAEVGWHLQLCLKGEEYPPLVRRLENLPIPFVFDHMGWVRGWKDPAEGVRSAAFQAVLHLLRNADCLVKIAGAFRLSAQGAPYRDTLPFTQALFETAPDRLVWGSDWPHVGLYEQETLPQVGELLDSLHEAASGDAGLLRRILVDTPERFYGLPGRP